MVIGELPNRLFYLPALEKMGQPGSPFRRTLSSHIENPTPVAPFLAQISALDSLGLEADELHRPTSIWIEVLGHKGDADSLVGNPLNPLREVSRREKERLIFQVPRADNPHHDFPHVRKLAVIQNQTHKQHHTLSILSYTPLARMI